MDKRYSAKKMMEDFSEYLSGIFTEKNGYSFFRHLEMSKRSRLKCIGDFTIKKICSDDVDAVPEKMLREHVKIFYKENGFDPEEDGLSIQFKIKDNLMHLVAVTGSAGEIDGDGRISVDELEINDYA